jgi:hypothetical protein
MRLEAQKGRIRTCHREGFLAIGLPISEAPTIAPFCVILPWRSMGWQCKRDPTTPPTHRRLVGSNSANLAGKGWGRKIRATAAGRRSGGKGKET